jgi:hypothetical protein
VDFNLFRETVAAKIGGGSTFDTDANGGVGTRKTQIPPHADLWVFSFSSTPHQFTVTWRNSAVFTTPVETLPGFLPFDGTTMESIQIDAADGQVFFFIVAHGTPPPASLGSPTAPTTTQYASASTGLFPLPASTGVEDVAGFSFAAVKGQVNYYVVHLAPSQAVAAAPALVYIALKGATSGTYYAVAYAGQTAGSFMVPSSENIVAEVRNANAADAFNTFAYVEGRNQ